MENKEAAMITDKNETDRSNEVPTDRSQIDGNGTPKQDTFSSQFYTHPISGDDLAQKEAEAPQRCNPSGEINMEATIDASDVIQAGGFGARDDLSSFLPVASDSTDFEASLLSARDYEEPQGERHRPGLGWSERRESE